MHISVSGWNYYLCEIDHKMFPWRTQPFFGPHLQGNPLNEVNAFYSTCVVRFVQEIFMGFHRGDIFNGGREVCFRKDINRPLRELFSRNAQLLSCVSALMSWALG